jgi:thioredoxin-related protein
MILDENGDVATAYSIEGVPTIVIVDKDGKSISSQYSATDKLLESILWEKVNFLNAQ